MYDRAVFGRDAVVEFRDGAMNVIAEHSVGRKADEMANGFANRFGLAADAKRRELMHSNQIEL
jgi:hypothetical protein